jgi:hypothetical protein
MKKIYIFKTLLCVVFFGIKVSNAQLVFSEEFNYPNGSFEGSNSGTGFSTAWSNVNTGNNGANTLAQISGNKLQVSLPASTTTTVRYDRTIPLTLDGTASTQEYWIGFWLRIPAVNLSTTTYGVTAQLILMRDAYSPTTATDMRLGYGKTSNFTTGANTANALTQFTRCASAINWPTGWNTATTDEKNIIGLSTSTDNLKYILVKIKKGEFLNTKMASTTNPNPNAVSNFDGYRYWIMSAPPSGPTDPIFTSQPNGTVFTLDAETGITFPIQSRVLRGDGGTTCVKDGITGIRIRVEGNPGATPFFAEFDDIKMGLDLNSILPSAPVPVNFGDITASAQKVTNIINWNTLTELNSKGFHVEKSEDGKKFTTIGFVKSKGNSTNNVDYAFTDNTPYNTYYRLREESLTGAMSNSKIVNVQRNEKFTIRVFPNPTTDVINVALNKSSKNNQIKVTDVTGKVITTKTFAGTNTQINMASYTKGLYFITINAEETNQVIKFIKE